MQIHRPRPNRASSRQRNPCHSHPRHQRPQRQHRRTHRLHQLIRRFRVIQLRRFNHIITARNLGNCHFRVHERQQLAHGHQVTHLRNVVQRHLFRRQQRRRHHRQRRILRPADRHGPPQRLSAPYPKFIHSLSLYSPIAFLKSPPTAFNLLFASTAPILSFKITNATRKSCLPARSACSAADTLAPLASLKILTARSASFSFVSIMSIIKFSYTCPSRAITAVLSMFRTIFCEVPAFNRVDPVSTSGPTSGAITIFATRPTGIRKFDVTATVIARRPPAINATTSFAEVPNVGGHSAASSTPIRPLDPAPT